MLQKVTTTNYQSVAENTLDLAPFTVIVGPSNTGKSATLRSLRTLVYNAATPSFVRAGTKAAQVELDLGDSRVAIERGAGLSTYRIFHGTDEQVYQKCGTTVPDAVKAVLQMPLLEGESLNFSFQFDRPFLLDSPGPRVAKVLGELTNVNVIYEAVREANRRRLEISARLRIRHEDERVLEDQLAGFSDLDDEQSHLETLDLCLSLVSQRAAVVDKLSNTIAAFEVHAARLTEARRAVGPALDVSGLESLSDRVARLRAILREVAASAFEAQQATAQVAESQAYIEKTEGLVAEILHKAGVCPVCGQVTK